MKIQVSAVDLGKAAKRVRKTAVAAAAKQTEPPAPPATSTSLAIDANQHPELYATLLDAIGCAHLSLGNYENARLILDLALTIRIRLFGHHHPLVAESKNHLASALRRLGDLEEAEDLLDEARRVNIKVFGKASLPVAADLNELAALYVDASRLKEADRAAVEGRKIYDKWQDRRATLLMDTQARVREMCSDYVAAEKIYDKALTIDRSTYLGTDHPRYITHAHNRATVLLAQGKLVRAEAEFRKTIASYLHIYGSDYPGLADAYSSLGRTLAEQSNYSAAQAEFLKALDLDIRRRGPRHAYVGYDKVNLARTEFEIGNAAAAEILLVEALDIYARALPKIHGYVASALTTLGLVYISQGRYAEAKKVLQRAIEIWKQLLAQCTARNCGNYQTEHSYSQAVLGHALTLDRNFSQAEPLLRNSLATLRQVRGRRDGRSARIQEWLDDLRKLK